MPPLPHATALFATALTLAVAGTPPIASAAQARVQWELEATLASLNEQGRLYREGGQPMDIASPPRQRWELGAVLDLADPGRGLPVLAVTPGGAAERLGLVVGDRVMSINGETRLKGENAATTLSTLLGARSGHVVLDVARGETSVVLQGTADSVSIPGYRMSIDPSPPPGSTCGQVSLQSLNAPRENLYPIRLVAINGRAIFDGDRKLYALDAGRHEITVDELIPADRFSGRASLDRTREQRYERTRKTMVLDVRAGVSYRIAARFFPERRADIAQGGYWEPTVARYSLQSCARSGIRAAGMER